MSPVPHPRGHSGRAGRTVTRRDLPGDRPTWTARSARIGGLLRALAELEAAGVALPAPVADRHVLHAWTRVAGPVVAAAGLRGDVPGASFTVDLDDVDALAEAGRALALALRRARRSADRSADPGSALVAQALHRAARNHDVAAEQLVAELGRAARLLAPAHQPDRAVVPVPVPDRAQCAAASQLRP